MLILITLTLFHCKNERDKITDSNILKTKNEIENKLKLPFSSSDLNYKIKDKNGYYIYDEGFKKDELGRISRVKGIFSKENIKLKLIEYKPLGDENTEPIVYLYSFVSNKKVDSLKIHETVEWEGSIYIRFILNKKLEVKISNEEFFSENEIKKEEFIYTINRKGIFTKTKNKLVINKYKSNNIWKGKYFFEIRNKDNLLTRFIININNVNNIEVKHVSDGNKEEIYSNLSLIKQESENIIKIIFNSKYEEMGEIYLEKSGNSYIISGKAISFINPGNDQYEIKKIK